MTQLYLEDFIPGRRFRTPGLTLTEATIIAFAERFDRQPFHLDVEAARATPFGGLIASGIHTIAVTFSLFLQTAGVAASSLGSPGLDEVRWLRPVRPGDTLHVEVEVVAARPSASKPDRGIVTFAYATVNQAGETVMTMRGHQLLRRRPT
jgi:acyl dehydratase